VCVALCPVSRVVCALLHADGRSKGKGLSGARYEAVVALPLLLVVRRDVPTGHQTYLA
jgi:hypothetical protein